MAKVWNFLKNYDYQWKFKLLVCLPIFLGLVFLDWLTKGLIASKYAGLDGTNLDVSLIPGFIKISYIINLGSAYGANSSNIPFTISLVTIITFFLTILLVFLNAKAWLIGITILYSGSFANLVGRAWAPRVSAFGEYPNKAGGVVDFLQWDFSLFDSSSYVFNLADLWVNIAIAYLIANMLVYGGLYIYNYALSKKAEAKDLTLEEYKQEQKVKKQQLKEAKKTKNE